jgi:hypothetical protein
MRRSLSALHEEICPDRIVQHFHSAAAASALRNMEIDNKRNVVLPRRNIRRVLRPKRHGSAARQCRKGDSG